MLRRLPIVRTDSLRQENLEGEQQTQGQQQGLNFGADTITAQVILPIRVGKETGLPVSLTFPQVEAAKRAGMVSNVSEWLRALQAVFAGVEKLSQAFDADRNKPLPDLNGAIRDHLAQSMVTPGPLADYLTAPYAQDVWTLLERLKVQHGDGRFLKTLEDLMLGLILKHYLKYDYVVGNPPYVRIQHLPEFQRRYWEDKYDWAHGNFDIYVPFVERAFQANGDPQNGWLTLPDPDRGITGGRLAYIIPNRFLNAGYAENLRRVLPERAHIRSLLNFGAATFRPDPNQPAIKLFREAGVYPIVLSAQVSQLSNPSIAFPVVRLRPFKLPSSPLDALKAMTTAYANLRAGKDAALPADWGDALTQSAAELNATGHEGAGWLTLTPAERVVWDKLEAVGAQVDPELKALLAQRSGDVPTGSTYRRLKNYTATDSGGFAGVQTSLDAVMVLKKVGEKDGGALLQLVPKGGGNPVWIERDALRPFLFGKDVERWHIDFQNWYVLFPYLNTSEGFRLMPSAEYRNFNLSGDRKAFVSYPADGPNVETAFPHFWKYLKANEAKLRGREDGKYKKRKKDEWRWYELAYARSLEYSARPKVVIQLLGRKNQVVESSEEIYFQGGGKGGGVYGISLSQPRNNPLFTAMISSDIADYYIKNLSIVYSGGYYSYADVYIKNLPVPEVSDESRQQLSHLACTLTALTGELRAIEGQIQRFPESVNQRLRQQAKLPDLVPLSQVSQPGTLARELRLATMYDGDTDIMGRETLRFGNGQLGGLSSAHADLVRATFAAVPGGKLESTVLLALNVPERAGAVQIYLDTLAEWRARVIELQEQITGYETELNDTVYELYGLNASDRAVIEDYLSRY